MQDQRVIQVALVVSLLLHVALVGATWHMSLLPRADKDAPAATNDDVQMILLPPETPAQKKAALDMPKAYTEIPDRQASATAPDKADYLALHHSLAADNVLGGDSDQPSAQKKWITDQVQIRREDLAGAEGVKVTDPVTAAIQAPQGVQPDKPGDNRSTEPRSVRESDDTAGAGRWALADPREGVPSKTDSPRDPKRGEQGPDSPDLKKWWNSPEPSILKQGKQGEDGDRGFDFDQAARGKVTSGVAIDGDFSLNTYEWDYAPWMHRFTNELYRHWVPPYAYKLGILTGHTVIKLVIARNGSITSLTVLETEGHESLHRASVDALKAFAPYAPLPPHFPEENLVITLGLYYPALQR